MNGADRQNLWEASVLGYSSGNAKLAQQIRRGIQKNKDIRKVGIAAIQNRDGKIDVSWGHQPHRRAAMGTNTDKTINQKPTSA
jgi:hypothetical protein